MYQPQRPRLNLIIRVLGRCPGLQFHHKKKWATEKGRLPHRMICPPRTFTGSLQQPQTLQHIKGLIQMNAGTLKTASQSHSFPLAVRHFPHTCKTFSSMTTNRSLGAQGESHEETAPQVTIQISPSFLRLQKCFNQRFHCRINNNSSSKSPGRVALTLLTPRAQGQLEIMSLHFSTFQRGNQVERQLNWDLALKSPLSSWDTRNSWTTF